ncbi:hypothetical protein DFQ28_008059 [Apophysomyces sp. BC1034]|nr:hypothetical protein DFQ28_008059 [Apophysomyces sp. BC1034]
MSYQLEYAKTGRSKCKGPKALCQSVDRSIKVGELRFGVQVDSGAFKGVTWKHWTCVTKQVIANMHTKLSGPEEIEGWDDLRTEDKQRVEEAWESGEVARPEKSEKSEETEETKEKEEKRTEETKPKKSTRKSAKASAKEEESEPKTQTGRKRKSSEKPKDEEKRPKKSQRKTAKKT